jgi:hypothetical protein
MERRGAGILLVMAVSLALPAAAGAATKTVQVGPYGAKRKAFENASGDANAFFRRVITIHKNDSVRWKINGSTR